MTKSKMNVALFAGLVALAVSAGCGGGSSGNGGPPPQSYAVTVTGTSGALQHTTQITVTVQ